MKRGFHIGKAALAAVTLTGMVSTMSATASADTGSNSMSMYIIGDARGFDPDIFTWSTYALALGIDEGLVHNSNKGPVAGIATSWSTSKDGLTWTFKLRDNAKFSNGDPVTAQDFVFGFERAVNPVTSVQDGGGMAAADFIPIKNEPEIRAGKKGPTALGVKAVDDHTFRVTLYRKDPSLIRDLTLPSLGWAVPLDPKVVKSMFKKDWANPAKFVTDGPYMVQSFTPNTQATLVPNPYYYGKVNLKQIKFVYTAGNTGLIDFKSGALDVAVLQSTDVKAAEADPTLKSQLHFFPTSVQYSLQVAPSQDTTLTKPLVRKALMMAIDRDTISKVVLQGTGTPAYDYYTPTWMDPWIKKGAVAYNPTQAKKLLAQAGYSNGKGFPVVTLDTGVSGTPDVVAQAIQQMWEQNLNINVKYNGMPYSTFSSTWNNPVSSGVGVRQYSGNEPYSELVLPQSMQQYLSSSVGQSLTSAYLPPAADAQFLKINNNQSLSIIDRQNQEVALFEKYLPKDILNWIQLGVKAFQTNNAALTQQFFLQHEQNVYDFPIYTPMQPLLIRSGINGYGPNNFLLTDSPKWLNDITRS